MDTVISRILEGVTALLRQVVLEEVEDRVVALRDCVRGLDVAGRDRRDVARAARVPMNSQRLP